MTSIKLSVFVSNYTKPSSFESQSKIIEDEMTWHQETRNIILLLMHLLSCSSPVEKMLSSSLFSCFLFCSQADNRKWFVTNQSFYDLSECSCLFSCLFPCLFRISLWVTSNVAVDASSLTRRRRQRQNEFHRTCSLISVYNLFQVTGSLGIYGWRKETSLFRSKRFSCLAREGFKRHESYLCISFERRGRISRFRHSVYL